MLSIGCLLIEGEGASGFCYEHGYLYTDENYLLLVKKKEAQP